MYTCICIHLYVYIYLITPTLTRLVAMGTIESRYREYTIDSTRKEDCSLMHLTNELLLVYYLLYIHQYILKIQQYFPYIFETMLLRFSIPLF